MGQTKSIRCVVIGGESLLIQCSEILLTAGHQIAAVVSENESIISWAADQNIVVYRKVDELRNQAPVFDYLFSIANLAFLPKNIIEMPLVGAINFHDGPLPDYAGLNTPNWALINQEENHGITWHVMQDEVDAGDILKQKIFNIAENETAFTLNAKCYEAAVECFDELVTEIGAGTLEGQPQDFTTRTLYYRDQRPVAACLIDWTQTAEEIEALTRALDFGTYKNPLGLAKIIIDDAVYALSEVTVLPHENGDVGSVVSVDENRLAVVTSNGVLSISKLLMPNGVEISLAQIIEKHDLKAGYIINDLADAQIEAFSQYYKSICVKEEAWAERLQSLIPIELPLSSLPLENIDGSGFLSKPFDCAKFSPLFPGSETEVFGDKIAALFSFYLARTSGKTVFDLAFNHSAINLDQPKAGLLFSNVVPLRISVDGERLVDENLKRTIDDITKTKSRLSYSHDLIARSPQLRSPLNPWHLHAPKILLSRVAAAEQIELSPQQGICDAELALVVTDDAQGSFWHFNQAKYSVADIELLEHQFLVLLQNYVNKPESTLSEISLLSELELQNLIELWGTTDTAYPKDLCVHQAIENQVDKTPSASAIAYHDEQLNFRDLNQKSNQIAHALIAKGVRGGDLVGVMLERSLELVPAMIGIWKAGAAYVPLDPSYPKERLEFMAEDANLALTITTKVYKNILADAKQLLLDTEASFITSQVDANPALSISSTDAAYIIYTSGSTGKPKGVMVEHQNVINFFAGMDARISSEESAPGVWLAVTSISFDISVLELFWTLSRGYNVVIYNDADQQSGSTTFGSQYPDVEMDFSLFYWNIVTDQNRNEKDKYRLLMESAKYGDENGFKAVWTPERHFGSFGGVFPNPSVISAALAVQTKQIEIRAGSCVLPLHSPIRVAEEWSIVDNLSGGRVGIAIAAGWQPNDFVIKPENHSDARGIMFKTVEELKQLWRGEKVIFPGPDGKDVEVETLPRPIQKELPIWVTVAGNPETYKQAGTIGANILTHLLGQSIEQVAENIKLYRQARKEAGIEGDGHVTLLLHTLIGDNEEEVKELSRQPMKDYLLGAIFLVKAAAWHFPTFKALSKDTGQSLDEYFSTISDEDLNAVLDFAFERYYTESGLFGTLDRCMEMVDRLKRIGVNEIGCLIDYGLATDKVLEHLPYITNLKDSASLAKINRADDFTIPALIKRHGVTHFQCTPSMANMLASDDQAHEALASLRCMMVGGEAFPSTLAKKIQGLVRGSVINMYGPTETTIWSSTYQLDDWCGSVPLGVPIANTQICVLDDKLQPLPNGVPGELMILGDGVTRGYLNRPELTDERFVNVTIGGATHRMYRTGDLGRIDSKGVLAFLGRLDHQVKILGYRIELGEIESVIQKHSAVGGVVVMPREDASGAQSLVAYVIATDVNKPIVEAELKDFAREDLPEYMVPGVIVSIDTFPLTPNGKIDRKAFPAPGQQEKRSKESYVAPDDDHEKIIAEVWKDVLGRDQVGVNENFFDLGGHSLLVIRALTRLRKEISPNIQVVQLFQHTTIRTLAQHLKNSDENTASETGQSRAQARKASAGRRRRGTARSRAKGNS